MSNIDELLTEYLSSDCDYDYLSETEVEPTLPDDVIQDLNDTLNYSDSEKE